MRNAFIIASVIGGMCWALTTLQTPAVRSHHEVLAEQQPGQNPWRRTARGWERISDWKLDDENLPLATHVHPALVASMELLLCIGSLVAFPPGARPSPRC